VDAIAWIPRWKNRESATREESSVGRSISPAPHRSKVPTSANTPNGKTRSASAFGRREEALLVSDMRLSLMNSIDRPQPCQ